MTRKITVSILLVLGLLLGQTAPALAAADLHPKKSHGFLGTPYQYAAAPSMPGIEEPAAVPPAVSEEPSQAPSEQPPQPSESAAPSEQPPQPSESAVPTEQPPQPSESAAPSEQPPQPSESAAPTEQPPQPSEPVAPAEPLTTEVPQAPEQLPPFPENLPYSWEPHEEEQSMYVTNQMSTPQAMNPSGIVRVLISIGDKTTELPFTVDGNYTVNASILERQSYTVKLEGGTLNLYSPTGCIASGPSLRIVQHTPTEGRNNFIVMHNIKYNDCNYLGDMEFSISGSYIRAVNHVYMEDYLYGVVPSEMSDYYPMEALKAQAIASRSYAGSLMISSRPYDVVDTSADQAYKGFNKNMKNSIQAVDQTAKTVISYDGVNPITAYFGASNGGWTEIPYHNRNTGREWPYYVIAEDTFDAANTASYHETIFFPNAFASYDEVTASDNDTDNLNPDKLKAIEYIKQAIVNSGQLGAGITRDQFSLTGITSLALAANTFDVSADGKEDHRRMPFGETVNRCQDLVFATGNFSVLITATGTSVKVTEVPLDLRYLDGSSTIKDYKAFNIDSLRLFVISSANVNGKAGFTISQKRYGHGMGLSQRGAQQRAKSVASGGGGQTYDQILSFYYPNTVRIVQTYNRTELTPINVPFTVTFDPQNGVGATGTTVLYGTAISPPARPARFGFNFTGWYAGGAPVSFPYMVTGNVTMTAGWAQQPKTNFLQNVALSSGSLNRGFSRAVTSYKITIGENDASFTLTPIKEYDGATMTINKKAVPSYTVNLANGKSAKITVKVTYLKKSKTYTFTVTRAKSTNNYLGSLGITAGSLSQPFDPNVMNYTLYLDENTKSTAIKASAAAGKAAKVSPASSRISLNNGQRKAVKITVKAQSGARRTYVINVVRAASTNASLKSLKASGLSPGFSPSNTGYTVVLPANKGAVTVSAKAAGYKAIVYIDGAKKSSKSIKLLNGQSTTVRVTVVSQAGNAMDYVITVIRQ